MDYSYPSFPLLRLLVCSHKTKMISVVTQLPNLLMRSQGLFYSTFLQVSPLSWQWPPSAPLPGSHSPRSPMSQQWISLYRFASSLSSLLWWSMAPCITLSATGNQARIKTKRRKTLYVSFPIGIMEISWFGFGLVLACLQTKPQWFGFQNENRMYEFGQDIRIHFGH